MSHSHAEESHSHGSDTHTHAVETLPAPSQPGSVLVDIGGDVGAAAVYVSASLDGEEIEIRAVGDEWAGVHVAVRERLLPDGSVWAALFPALTEGDYEIRVRFADPDGPTEKLTVSGGRVASLHWLED
jgi:hypothetical protein